jgi:multicomponent Na+:H+ antiporter subunit D
MVLTGIHRELGRVIVVLSVLASLVMSVMQLVTVVRHGTIHYAIGGYQPPFGIEFVVDSLNACILVMISLIGFLTLLFAGNFNDE